MEIACRELEKKLGFIDAENESLGIGVIDFQHILSIPIGTPLRCRASLEDINNVGNRTFLTYKVQVFAIVNEQEVAVSNVVIHKSCVLNLQGFRAKQEQRFPVGEI